MKAYKLVLKYAKGLDEFNFCEIRYFMEKDLADEINLELQTFLKENPYEEYIQQYLFQYSKLILLLQKNENFTESKRILFEKLENRLSNYIKFISKWPEDTRIKLLHFFSHSHKDSVVLEFEIEEGKLETK